MNETRVNEIARELQLKARTIILALPELGINRKATHSTTLSAEETCKVRAHFTAKPKPKKPRKHWVNDTDGRLAIAKSIAARFGIEIVEEEFFQK
jgi:Translation initiation factor IF-2, N-terminal region